MQEEKASYRQIFKATSLFGGVQLFNILVAIVRSKLIAVLLGPSGMGVAGLLNSTTTLLSNLTNFGLGVSSVKEIAAAEQNGNLNKISTVIGILRKLVWFTGLLGMLLTITLSSWLSEITFGNTSYTLAFVWLSITLLLNQLTLGQDAVLQGMRKLKSLAKVNMIGSVIGLIVSVPFYYLYRIDGIVPATIVTSILTTAVAWYFARDIKVSKIPVSNKKTFFEGKAMVRMGFMLSLTGLMTVGTSHILRIYISNKGGTTDVGLYNAGFTIIGTYVGLVFSAMATDFYPRLSGVAQVNKNAIELVNHQAEIAIIILAPILTIFLIFVKWVVVLIYSSQFVQVDGMIHWAAIGIYFKAVSWSIAFLLLAKGDAKQYFWNEFLANLYVLALNIIGYQFWGLEGLGVSFLIGYIIYLLQIYLFCSRKYQFSFTKKFYHIFLIQLAVGLTAFGSIKLVPSPDVYLLGFLIVVVSVLFSFWEMNKKIDLKSFLLKYLIRK